MKNNAIDYLIDLAEKDDCNTWLSYIIKLFIEKQGIIDENEKNDLANYLLQRKEIPNIASPSTNFSTKNEKIILTKLEHHSGVNALSPFRKNKGFLSLQKLTSFMALTVLERVVTSEY